MVVSSRNQLIGIGPALVAISRSILNAVALVLLVAVLTESSAIAATGSASLPSPGAGTRDRPTVVRIPFPLGPATTPEIYFASLLELAFEKTRSTDGPFAIIPLHQAVTSKRLILQLASPTKELDVIWTSNSKEREQLLLPIKISILRGLNSYRIFLIRQGDQPRFDRINSLNELRRLEAGQGAHWPDTAVLLANGLPVISAARGDLLIDMLKQKRFDYFPRGLYEVWEEQKANADDKIVIEEALMLHYAAPIYFFLNKNDTALANRIERGLRIAQQDGSFDELFFSFPAFKKGHDLIKRRTRKVLELKVDFPDQD